VCAAPIDTRHEVSPPDAAAARSGSDATRASRQARIGRLGLAALLLGGLWIALGAASNDLIVDTAEADEPSWLAGPLAHLTPGLTDLGFSIAILAMLGGYAAVVSCAHELPRGRALATVGVLVLAFTLTTPILSADLFGYIGYARLGALHHLNPYQHGVDAARSDPIFPLIFWTHATSPYGPLFTLGSYALASTSLAFATWTFKVIGGLACLASVGLAWWCARRLGREPLRAALILGANPLLLIYAVGGAHNDLIVMLAAMAAFALLIAGRTASAGGALAAATAIKVTGGLLLPFALLGAPRPRRLLLGVVAVALPLSALTLAVFGSHILDGIGHIATQGSFNIAYTGPDLLGRLLGTGITPGVRAICGALAACVVIACAWAVLRRGMDWLDGAGWSVLAVMAAIASFVPWYLAWVLPMGALTRGRALSVAVLAFTAFVIATHMPLLGFPESE
jgi:alpha-1,6-mannosyltransferase